MWRGILRVVFESTRRLRTGQEGDPSSQKTLLWMTAKCGLRWGSNNRHHQSMGAAAKIACRAGQERSGGTRWVKFSSRQVLQRVRRTFWRAVALPPLLTRQRREKLIEREALARMRILGCALWHRRESRRMRFALDRLVARDVSGKRRQSRRTPQWAGRDFLFSTLRDTSWYGRRASRAEPVARSRPR